MSLFKTLARAFRPPQLPSEPAPKPRRQTFRRTTKPAHVEVPDGHRWCPACREVHPESAFGRNRNTASGFASYCLAAERQRVAEYQARNRERNASCAS